MAQGHNDAESAGPGVLSATPTLSALLHALRRRWLLAITLALTAAIGASVAVFYVLPPKYLVSMRLRVVAKSPGADDIDFPILKANMEALVKSPLVLSAALNDKTKEGRDIKDLDIITSKGMGTVEWLEKALKTDFLLGPEVLRVSLAADHAEEAAEVLNAIGSAFLNEYAEAERAKKQLRLADMRVKKERIEEELRSLRNILDSLYRELNVKDREAATVQQQQLLHKLQVAETIRRSTEDEMNRAESEILICNAKLKKIDVAPIPEEVLFEIYGKDQILLSVLKRIAETDEDIARTYRDYNEPYATPKAIPLKHAKIELLKQKTELEEKLRPSIEKRYRDRVREELKHQIEIAGEKVHEFSRRHASLTKEISDLDLRAKAVGNNQHKPPQILATEEKIEMARMALNHTAQKISEVELEVPGSRVLPVTRASPPAARDRSQQNKIAGAGGLGIFLMALFGVAFFEFRARRISFPDDVAQGLGLNVVGTIPAMRAIKNPASEQRWRHQLQESVDAIRTVLLHQARGNALQVVMITSANCGEGKTTLATQLAASLARAWKRVLVIDGDLRHPATHKFFDIAQEPGLAEVLRGEVEAADAIRATSLGRLWVLPAGNGDAHAIQALAQDQVATLFGQLKQQYDFIIVDTPPVLPVTDSLLLGQHADGVLFAVLQDVSRAPAVYAAQQKLEPLGVRTLGAVVLGTASSSDEKSYNYALHGSTK
jgi:succinoglycan biosynthesis transport protein ExoP